MATKTISIDREAYERLRRARKHPRESFSKVIQRGRWEDEGTSARSWLDSLMEAPVVDDDILDALEGDQNADVPPKDKWRS